MSLDTVIGRARKECGQPFVDRMLAKRKEVRDTRVAAEKEVRDVRLNRHASTHSSTVYLVS